MLYNSFARHRAISNKKNIFSHYCTDNPQLVSNAECRLCRIAEELAH
jgi:hypothetical protein